MTKFLRILIIVIIKGFHITNIQQIHVKILL